MPKSEYFTNQRERILMAQDQGRCWWCLKYISAREIMSGLMHKECKRDKDNEDYSRAR